MTSTAYVQLVNLSKQFGQVCALSDFNLEIAEGELVALLGPSGCGKTTALRALTGLEELDSGRVIVDGKDITGTAPNKRNMGMVFQAYSLFPHMTARENVEYGLRMKARRISSTERAKLSGELLELVGLSTHANHFPHQMSGGQQQRVALARALAIKPKVLLLDEPLSALDAKVRTQLREEIRRIQLEIGTTTLFVTHDQEEALGVADRVGVMRQGILEQIATPAELYQRPQSAFVAEFVGLTNPLPATVSAGNAQVLGMQVPVVKGSIESGKGLALIRPEWFQVEVSSSANAKIAAISFLGSTCRLTINLMDGTRIRAQIPSTEAANLGVETNVKVTLKSLPVFVKSA
jgi:putative spermidine/putrescine transport system ATP-binding protein